jgi:hypothetical protein
VNRLEDGWLTASIPLTENEGYERSKVSGTEKNQQCMLEAQRFRRHAEEMQLPVYWRGSCHRAGSLLLEVLCLRLTGSARVHRYCFLVCWGWVGYPVVPAWFLE